MIKVTEKCQYLVLQDEDGLVFLDKDDIPKLIRILEIYEAKQQPEKAVLNYAK